ncbi:aspartate aminotransferase family protein [Isachenkonia alkalipeptolytica]|uniref:Aminotransferase class III-fold pyridoxal phosphate-dependent enzyme n=1 Tax=Isachenkonia alkalipeptolytica TaxID=2565777 RepID=A0AA43XHL8_9CLOT|nr:acetylornithine transaminase [Isachenkonia alkalipeptolytica]NBG87038.1 aminotransferase class III-fold pyridoxal phosphate-dependent enzyme [Isachenkonia alkalipeptolytica]
MEKWIDREENILLNTYNRMPVVVSHGEGCYLYDDSGKKYLDMFSGLAVNALGHCHPEVVEAGKNQLEKYLHISNFFYCKQGIALGEALVSRSFPGKVFYTNTGTEGVEAAVKYLYKIGKKKGKRGIVCLSGSFHGRTLGALGLTKIPSVAQDFPVIDYPVYENSREALENLEELFDKKEPVGMILEPISGSGGIEVLSREEMKRISELCEKYDVVLCMDEIQTGIGRTGKFFAYQHYGVIPDLVIFAKAVGGGSPLGGMLVHKNIDGYFKPGDHGTTFGPSPLGAALGRKVLEIIDEDFLMEVEEKGRFLQLGLENLQKKHPESLGEIRGKGLMMGVDLKIDPAKLKRNFLEEQVLINITAKNVLRLLPPLIIREKEIREFLLAFEKALSK